jgi:hypothetical protein
MRVPLTLLAVLLTSGSPAVGQPAKHDARKPVQASHKPAEVVLASAETVRAPGPADPQASAAPKRPAPRVTTCRCGDPLPNSETPED